MENQDYEHDSEDEGIEDNLIGGYHPVHFKEALLNRYVVMQKGRFSTVWLAQDFQHDTLVTLKFKRVHLNIWKLYKIKQQKPNLLEILQKIAQNVYKSIWIQSLKEYYANVQIICSNNVDDSHRLALLKKYINQRFAFQSFRISEISFQFLDCQRPTLINELGIKCIMRNLRCILNQREKMKKRSNLIRILEDLITFILIKQKSMKNHLIIWHQLDLMKDLIHKVLNKIK
ncbi:unnamed protein product [Paramecium primaurelia]|uniref:non-specific serine/threonine protein kinase n=1 Tax=Paramecium primaurelia TaxID=5886 RepID=A0A8S1MKS0_PARPR|nr:unnamed protein product [Paramecium primaurelia]